LDLAEKFLDCLDYLFGEGCSEALPKEGLELVTSKRTGRLRYVYLDGKLLATVRHDGSIALTVFGARLLLKAEAFKRNCVVVKREAVEAVRSGRSVFSKHVLDCGDLVRPGSDVAVLSPEGEVIAVGRAKLSCRMMKHLKSGVAVKVREGSK